MGLTFLNGLVLINMVRGKAGLKFTTDNFVTTEPRAAYTHFTVIDNLLTDEQLIITVDGTDWTFQAVSTALSSPLDLYDQSWAATASDYSAHIAERINAHPTLPYKVKAISLSDEVYVFPVDFTHEVSCTGAPAPRINPIANITKVEPVVRENYQVKMMIRSLAPGDMHFEKEVEYRVRPVLDMGNYWPEYIPALHASPNQDPVMEVDLAPALRSFFNLELPVFTTALYSQIQGFLGGFRAMFSEEWTEGGIPVVGEQLGSASLSYILGGASYQDGAPSFPDGFLRGDGDFPLFALVGLRESEPKRLHREDIELITLFNYLGYQQSNSFTMKLELSYWSGSEWLTESVNIPVTNSQAAGYENGTETPDTLEFLDCLQVGFGMAQLDAFISGQTIHSASAAYVKLWFESGGAQESMPLYYELVYSRQSEVRHFYFLDESQCWQHFALEGDFTSTGSFSATDSERHSESAHDPQSGQYHSSNRQLRDTLKVKSAPMPRYYQHFCRSFLLSEHIYMRENGVSKKVLISTRKFSVPPASENIFTFEAVISLANREDSISMKEVYG